MSKRRTLAVRRVIAGAGYNCRVDGSSSGLYVYSLGPPRVNLPGLREVFGRKLGEKVAHVIVPDRSGRGEFRVTYFNGGFGGSSSDGANISSLIERIARGGGNGFKEFYPDRSYSSKVGGS
ncbi:MAG: hypothetical protein Q8P57_04335 [Candidatus Pacearchaeota archaeon]|nr:hypothetical protein [Candidatus Pacearchaeota archaeon]